MVVKRKFAHVPWQEVLDLAEQSHQLFQRAPKSIEDIEENSSKALDLLERWSVPFWS
jgi:hypothetical protein